MMFSKCLRTYIENVFHIKESIWYAQFFTRTNSETISLKDMRKELVAIKGFLPMIYFHFDI